MDSVIIPAQGKVKYFVPGDRRTMRAYEFRLSSAQKMNHIDLNSMWLSCGKEPFKSFAGAWLLTIAGEVVAYLPETTEVVYNAQEERSYIRLWFFKKLPVTPKEVYRLFMVRVLFKERVPELFLRVGPGDESKSTRDLLDCLPLNTTDKKQWMLTGVPQQKCIQGKPQPPSQRQHQPPPPSHQQRQRQHQAPPLQQPRQPPPIYEPWGSQPTVMNMSQQKHADLAAAREEAARVREAATKRSAPPPPRKKKLAPPPTPIKPDYDPMALIQQPQKSAVSVKKVLDAVREAKRIGVIEEEEYDPCKPQMGDMFSGRERRGSASSVGDPFAVPETTAAPKKRRKKEASSTVNDFFGALTTPK